MHDGSVRATWFNEESHLARLLHSLDSTDQLEFPVCVEHRDHVSPDFVLSSKDAQIGLEVTGATDEELIRGRQIVGSHSAPFIDVTWLKDKGQRRSNDALTKTMFDYDAPWEDDSDVLDHKLNKIAQAAARKSKKFHCPDFHKSSETWLLIYDDYFRFTSLDSAKYFSVMLPQFLRNSSREFERVYILCDQFVYRWHQEKLSQKREKPVS